jgi:hypothetical protein
MNLRNGSLETIPEINITPECTDRQNRDVYHSCGIIRDLQHGMDGAEELFLWAETSINPIHWADEYFDQRRTAGGNGCAHCIA